MSLNLNGADQPKISLTGDDLLGMFAGAHSSLAMHASQVDALNVFPVPDGDTGTNMVLTLKAVEPKLAGMRGGGAGGIAAVIAREAMMGARGNSGVILSQFFAGMAVALKECETFGGRDLTAALEKASEQAYKGVSKPVEGTMLTVIRVAAEWAQRALTNGDTPPLLIWEAACQGAWKALAQTPDLLPVLKEAGVVDAGGLGIVAMMEGARAYLLGQELRTLAVPLGSTAPSAHYLASTEEIAFGYCIQLLVSGECLDVEKARRRIEELSHSTIVVGDATAIKVHVHADDPGPLISYAVSLGSLRDVKIENMDRQHQGFMARHDMGQSMSQAGAIALVAVVAGEGLEDIFRQYGVGAIVSGGQTMNPSAGDLVAASEQTGAPEVILLPNNPNILGTAQQAAALSKTPVHVVPTTSIPQGIAALLAFDPDADITVNLASMQAAIGSVVSGEVTRASRTAHIGGVDVQRGQAIALLEGVLVAAADEPAEALEALCRKASPPQGASLILLWGGSTTETEAQAAGERLQQCMSGIEVQVVPGGQPFYEFLVSIG